jgi:hypothetical protein
MSLKQNLVTGKGETFDLALFFKDALGVPVDLTGHSVDLAISKPGAGTEVGTYPAVVDDSGNISIKVDDETTDLWPKGKLAYIVKHTSPDGDEKWLLYGALTVMSGADV